MVMDIGEEKSPTRICTNHLFNGKIYSNCDIIDINELTSMTKIHPEEYQGPSENSEIINNDLEMANHNIEILTKMKQEEIDWKEDVEVLYKVEETPPIIICFLLAFQHYISMFFATLTIPILLAPAICLGDDHIGKSQIIGTLFVASGIITLLQTFFGIRLPIVQAGTFALLVPTLSLMNLPTWQCPSNIVPADFNLSLNDSEMFIITGSREHKEVWMMRLREIQGSIMCAAFFEIFVGATGLVGLMMKYIGPLCICPTVTLLGLSLFKSATIMAAKQWWIFALTIILMIFFSQYLANIKIPFCTWSRSRGCTKQLFPIFKMFAVVFSVLIAWLICYILTVSNVFGNTPGAYGYEARTDLRMDAIYSAQWFRMPYPGQWGLPTVSISGVCAILCGIIATTIESVGDYHACAKLSGAPPPPISAINRGILIEGLGSFLDGMFGTGNGTTSTSINVGVIGITKVGSRRVVQVSALFMIVLGLFTKFGALFITVPDPVIAGCFFILFGMIVAVGLSNLQTVDMNSGRNMFIIGFSIFTGIAIPQWIMSQKRAINTGILTLDNVFTVLLSTGMFVGGIIGFILDNTIPGTYNERGLKDLRNLADTDARIYSNKYLQHRSSVTYDLPISTETLDKYKIFKFLPFCPSFRMYPCTFTGCYKKTTPL